MMLCVCVQMWGEMWGDKTSDVLFLVVGEVRRKRGIE